MNSKFCLLFGALIVHSVVNASSSSEALAECSKLHHVDLEKIANSNATYSNSNCALSCVIGNVSLPTDSIHERQPCPEDTDGICHDGKCTGGQKAALRECGLKHNLDFHNAANNSGTSFTNSHCTLKCIIGGVQWSESHLHEGSPCPTNSNGVCRNGTCVNLVSKPSTTPIAPTTVTKPSIESFTLSNIRSLNISIVSTDPEFYGEKKLLLLFQESPKSAEQAICIYHGNQEMRPNMYNYEVLRQIPTKLTKKSKIIFDYWQDNEIPLGKQSVDIYSLLAVFYRDHELAFGKLEHYVRKFPIRKNGDSTLPKLLDLELDFEIVFRK